jgi:FGGY-family pentulose kinase
VAASGKPVAQEGLVLAVDVGSTSARSGVFDMQGRMLSTASVPFDVHKPQPDQAEHDSEQIWSAVGLAVRSALRDSGRAGHELRGIAFDATCSLVLLDAAGAPVTVSSTGDDRWNVVMWADHRAHHEAREITATGHRVLDFVGGTMSPEMQLPKLAWLKRHMPQAWSRYGLALDLTDYLTWRATGVISASACTLACKWTYLHHESPAWQDDLFGAIGLAGVREQLQVPASANSVGSLAGGLSAPTALAWGLPQGIPVAVGLIDAHAGAVGVFGATPPEHMNRQIALIAGTSSCHMALSNERRQVPGVWGPYWGAVLPGWWLNEGGQSASGSLLDYVLASHALGASLGDRAHDVIGAHILRRMAEVGPGYASELLVVPDFHGNRAPLARADVRGVVHGLNLDSSLDALAKLYHATAVGIAYGTRHIIDTLNTSGYNITELHLTGGHAKSELLVRLYADATNCAIVLPREEDGVLLGTAVVAAAASGCYADFLAAGRAMVHTRSKAEPHPCTLGVHERGYRAFRRMLAQRQEILDILAHDSSVQDSIS